MKKNLLFASFLAISLLFNCSKENSSPININKNEINFNAHIESSTKAEIINNNNFKEFNIYGYQTEKNFLIASDLNSIYINNIKVIKNKDNSWTHDNKYYWSENKLKTHFFAVSPITALTNYKASLNSYPSFECSILPEISKQKDIVVSSLTNQNKPTENKNIDLEFKHILTQINFSLQGKEIGYKYHIDQIELLNIKDNGTFIFSDNNGGLWKNLKGEANYSILENNENLTLTDEVIKNLDIKNGLIIIPQENTKNAKLKISYTAVQTDTGKETFNGSKEADLSKSSWDIGINTRYYIELPTNNDDITFTTKISNWNDKTPIDKKIIKLNKTELSLSKNEKTTLTATLIPEDKEATYKWESSNSEIVSVNKNGEITALKSGKNIEITVKAYNLENTVIAQATCIVNVKDVSFINIPDSKFKQALIDAGIDKNKDGKISTEEALAVKDLDIKNKEISSLEGIEYFKNIENLNCSNNNIETLDISKNINLTDFSCYSNKLKTIDVSKNTNLYSLMCCANEITSLNIDNNENLNTLYIGDTQIESINLNKNINLTNLSLTGCKIESLDISKNIELSSLDCSATKITSLNIDKNTKLYHFNCSYTNINSLDTKNNLELGEFYCNDTKLSSLDISTNKKLELMCCTSCPNLENIYVWENFDKEKYPQFTKPETAKYIIK